MRHRACDACATIAIASAVVLIGSIASEGEARAQAAPAPAASQAPARRIVEVLVAGGGADASSLDDTVRELLGRLTLVMESQSVARIDADDASFRSTSRPSLLARVGIDLRSRDVAQVTVVDGRTGDITLRRTLRRDGPPAVVREELAHVVQSAIDPMVLTERDRATAPPPPPPPPPAPPAAPAPAPEPEPAPAPAPPPAPVAADRDVGARPAEGSSPLALDLATGPAPAPSRAAPGSSRARAAAPTWSGAAASVPPSVLPRTMSSRSTRAPRSRSRTSACWPSGPPRRSRSAVAPRLRSTSLRAAAWTRSTSRRAPTSFPPIARLRHHAYQSRRHRRRDGSSRDRIRHLASLTIASDVDLTSRQWVVASGDGTQVDAFAPSRVRPLVMLGFTFTAFGDGRFAARQVAR